MDEIKYFVGIDGDYYLTIQKGIKRGGDIAIHNPRGGFVRIFVLSSISLPDMGFQKLSTSKNGGRPSFVALRENKDEVVEILSKQFRMVNK
ncbi:MAG: hypothetical protein UW88_C0014G0039 [Candidatus Collierbacteria bacterium GW2011_GWD2_45_10]|nr:MAG: hypothetical protein UW88_C0014G0039 [Candidatus Collierbacteria bacterium GW2011_GWD2_45_10]